jgi:hypothetical protein
MLNAIGIDVRLRDAELASVVYLETESNYSEKERYEN